MKESIKIRNISRLCHFTKSKNIPYIFNSEEGILANEFIKTVYLDKNDENRYDNKEDYISCSIEYPNTWYLNRIKEKDILFKDWVIITIDPYIMCKEDTLFSVCNAATAYGAHLKSGKQAFLDMFNNNINIKRNLYRNSSMLSCCPTDDQAEVMIYRSIPNDYITGIIVPTQKKAKELRVQMNLSNISNDISIVIAEDLFNGNWSKMVRRGIRPEEILWEG